MDLLKLWHELGRAVTDDDLIRCGCTGPVHRYRCDDCGFSYFDPAQTGDGGFYEHLSIDDSAYYNDQRPEFSHAIRRAQAKGYRKVLDIGCGSGNFLNHARKAGLDPSGMELNEKAAAAAAAKGHPIFPGILTADFAEEQAGRFDMVTLFQVVEHLADPVGILRLARHLVRPGGTLMFSVPNSRGLYQFFPLDPHQWPPHHISRWRTEDFPRVAQRLGMILSETSGDRLYGKSITDFHRRNNLARRALGLKTHSAADLLIELGGLAYRGLGLKNVTKNLGLSIHCCLQQPDTEAAGYREPHAGKTA
jgi:SAM-dependent methyltransferase